MAHYYTEDFNKRLNAKKLYLTTEDVVGLLYDEMATLDKTIILDILATIKKQKQKSVKNKPLKFENPKEKKTYMMSLIFGGGKDEKVSSIRNGLRDLWKKADLIKTNEAAKYIEDNYAKDIKSVAIKVKEILGGESTEESPEINSKSTEPVVKKIKHSLDKEEVKELIEMAGKEEKDLTKSDFDLYETFLNGDISLSELKRKLKGLK